MSQFLYNHTKYRCDQKLKIYDPNDRSLSGLYNKNLKQAKIAYFYKHKYLQYRKKEQKNE